MVVTHTVSTGCQFLYNLDNINNNGMTTLALIIANYYRYLTFYIPDSYRNGRFET